MTKEALLKQEIVSGGMGNGQLSADISEITSAMDKYARQESLAFGNYNISCNAGKTL